MAGFSDTLECSLNFCLFVLCFILLFYRIIPLRDWRKQMKYWKASNFLNCTPGSISFAKVWKKQEWKNFPVSKPLPFIRHSLVSCCCTHGRFYLGCDHGDIRVIRGGPFIFYICAVRIRQFKLKSRVRSGSQSSRPEFDSLQAMGLWLVTLCLKTFICKMRMAMVVG